MSATIAIAIANATSVNLLAFFFGVSSFSSLRRARRRWSIIPSQAVFDCVLATFVGQLPNHALFIIVNFLNQSCLLGLL